MRLSSKLICASTILLVATACASPAEQTSTAGEPTSSVVQGSATDSTTPTAEPSASSEAPESEAAATSEEEAATAELSVEDYGFTQTTGGEYSEPSITYAVIFSNSGNGIAGNAQFQIAFEGAGGEVLHSEQGYVTAVLPGTSVAHAGYAYEVDGAEKMTVQLMPGDTEALEDDAANFEVSDITTAPQEFGGLKTTATVESPFTKDLEMLETVAVYRDDAGDIVGGDMTYLNFVPAGGKAAVTIDGMTWEGDPPAETEVYVALTSLTLLD
jgi:hypothetical protein